MQAIFHIVKQVLSDRKVSVVLVLLVILGRAIQLTFYLDSFFDTTFQVIAARNFVEGHGISIATVNTSDLSEILYRPLVDWPPGYSILLSPFYLLFGKNYLLACLALELLAAVAIILVTRRILQLLGLSLALINLFTLLTGFFIYYFYYTGSTDSLSIAFFLGAVCLVISALKENRKWNTRSLLAGACLLLGASLKYLFFPVVFVIPVFLLVYGRQNRMPAVQKAAFYMLGILFTGIAAMYLYQKNISGTGAYISATGRGFFPEHLLRSHPFLPAAFLTPNSFRKLPGPAEQLAMDSLRVIHLLLLAVLLLRATRSFIQHGLKNASLQRSFLYLSLAIALTIIAVLSGLSLLVDKELIPPDRWWTYVEDARYYGLGDILLHLSVFLLFYHYRHKVSGWLRPLIWVLPFLLIPEAVRGMIFTAKRVRDAGTEIYYWEEERSLFRYGQKRLAERMQQTNTKKAIVSGSLYYGNYRASLHMNLPVLQQQEALSDPALWHTREPVLILAMIRSDLAGSYPKLTGYSGTELAGELNGFYFYTVYVSPR